MLQQARIQAIANGTLDQFNKDLEEYINLSGKETTGGGGTPDKTPMEQAVEQLQDQRKEILNTNNAYSKLRQAGVSAGKAFKIAQDPILAAALAAEKVGTKKWKELVALINKVNTSTVAAELRSLTNDNTAEAAATKNIEKVEKYLTKLGYSADQIDRVVSQIGDNPDILQKFVNDMKDGKINAQSIRDYLASIKNIKVELTIEDMEAQVDKAFSDIQAGFAAQREVINLDFETGTNISGKNKINPLTGLPYNTTEINKQIKAAQQYISERQYAIDDYEYQLSGIEEKEASINESYDKRIEALDKVQSLNEKISQGQQDQLSVANALASGDIAAAAEAAQQMQANQAAKALEDQKAAIEAARAAELAGVRSANGLSRIEIEEKIKNLKTEIAKKEEEILEPQSRALELAEDYRDAANDSVDYLGKNETEWKKIEAGVRLAKVEAEGYKKAISDALALIPQLNSGYASAGATNAVDKSKLDSINQKIANAERYKSNMQAQGRWAEFAGATTKLDQYYAERKKILGLASGGSVAGPGTATSDSIPALLSDGEFVVRASSVDRIGTGVLDYINEKGQMPGFAAGGSVNKPKPKPGDAGYYKPRNSSEAIGMGMQIVMDNITRGLFGQAGANSKYGVKNTAGDIIDSAATTALNALPIPAVKALSKLPKAGAAVDKAVASAYIKNTLANPRIAVGMTASGVEGAIKDKALKSLFQVEESGAFITRKTGYDTVRREIERDILGIPLNATSAQRPTYGTVASAFGTKIPYSLTQKMPGLTGDALRLFDPRFNKVTRQYMYSMASNASDVAPMALATTGKGAKGTFTLGDSFRNEIGSSLFNLGNKQDAKTAAQLILKDFKSPVSELRNISPNSLPYVEAQLAPGSNPFNLIKKFGVPVRENNKEYSYYLTRDTAQKEAIKLSNLLKQNDLSKVKTGTFRDVQPAWQHQLAQANLKLRNSPVGRVIRDAPYNLSQMLNNFKKPKNYQGNDGTYIRKPVDFGDNELAMGGLVKPKYFNSGGMVKKYAMGGDVVPSMLTPGEFVMSKYAVKNYGVDTMKAMNSGTLNEGSVYNYSVNVSVQSNSNPDQIARAVMTQIRQIDSQRIRSSNF
jgi:DNA-binding HxlR family transcriptional regulator